MQGQGQGPDLQDKELNLWDQRLNLQDEVQGLYSRYQSELAKKLQAKKIGKISKQVPNDEFKPVVTAIKMRDYLRFWSQGQEQYLEFFFRKAKDLTPEAKTKAKDSHHLDSRGQDYVLDESISCVAQKKPTWCGAPAGMKTASPTHWRMV